MLLPELQIELNNIEANLKYFKSITRKNTEVGIVVKSNAYGLGLKKIVGFLTALNVQFYFTATLEEAIRVREINKDANIYTLNGFYFDQADKYQKYNIFPVLNSIDEINQFLLAKNKPFAAAIQINTGMNRLGVNKTILMRNINLIKRVPSNLIISHLACADDINSKFNNFQRSEFLQCCSFFPKTKKSLAASHGALLSKDFHFDLVRLGIGAYGGIKHPNLKPVIQIKAPVIQINTVEKGMGIGYNLSFETRKKMKIATIATGYGDGISRALSNRGFLFCESVKCPIIGRISMDLITVDISHLKNEPSYLNFFSNNYGVSDMATESDTISHEVLAKLGNRFRRKYFL